MKKALLDKLKELTSEQYGHMFFLEGDEFEKAASAMLGNVSDATSSNAHNKEMEMFLYKLYGKMVIKDATYVEGKFFSPGPRPEAALLEEFSSKGYPLAQELDSIARETDTEKEKIFLNQILLDNPFATEKQKEDAKYRMDIGFDGFVRDYKKLVTTLSLEGDYYIELEKRKTDEIPVLDSKYLSVEEGRSYDGQLDSFMGDLYDHSHSDNLDGEKSLEFLTEFAERGYPSAQGYMGMIATERNDKKALNYWAKQVEKNPFSTEEQKKNAHDVVKDTQAFMAQFANGGRQ